MTDLIVGLLVTAIPAFAVGYLMLNKQPPIFRMFLVMVLVGLGYLTATGAIEDIGSRVIGNPKVVPVDVTQPAEKPAPAPDQPAAEAPTESAPAPAAEETKTEAAPAPAEPATTTAPAASETPPEATTAPDTAQPPASTQVDPYPGAPKPAQ